MDEIITYSLRNNLKHSDSYYQDVAAFVDRILKEIRKLADSTIEDFQMFIVQNRIETLRTFDEYALEYLMLGTYWHVHGGHAIRLHTLVQRILAGLGRLRKNSDLLKPLVDFWRGLLGIKLLSGTDHQNLKYPLTIENYSRLLDWMSATGELTEEYSRLIHWLDFLKSQKPQKTAAILKTTSSLAAWFEFQAVEALGPYTQNVEDFLKSKHPQYRLREDNFFCGRQEIEYHFNMIGTEILNRAYRDDFLKTDRKVVLLPPCMKAKLEAGCEAISTPIGEKCMACTPTCRVHQLTKLGKKHGFTVMVMPHDMKVFSKNGKKSGLTGIVGISCPLTNTSGGWEMKSVGVPAQGVLLDYCGCPWHWHDDGIATDINFNQLLKVVAIKEF